MSQLDISKELAELSADSGELQVREGEIWRACPHLSEAVICWQDPKGNINREQRTLLEGSVLVGSAEVPPVPQWIEITIHPDSVQIAWLRAGVILGRALAFQRGILAAGHTRAPKNKFSWRPQLIVDYPSHESIDRPWVRYHLWNIWGVSATVGVELVSRLAHVNDGTVAPEQDRPGVTPLDRRILPNAYCDPMRRIAHKCASPSENPCPLRGTFALTHRAASDSSEPRPSREGARFWPGGLGGVSRAVAREAVEQCSKFSARSLVSCAARLSILEFGFELLPLWSTIIKTASIWRFLLC